MNNQLALILKILPPKIYAIQYTVNKFIEQVSSSKPSCPGLLQIMERRVPSSKLRPFLHLTLRLVYLIDANKHTDHY